MAGQYTIDDLCSKIAGNYSYRSVCAKKTVEANENVQNLQENIEKFRKNVKCLKKYTSGVTSKSRLENQIKELVDSYNGIKKTSGSITDKDLCKKLSKLDKLFSDNEKALKKIGIKKLGNKFTFDKEALEDAADAEIDSFFIGKDSFISNADKIIRGIDKDAEDLEYETVIRNVSKTVKYDRDKIDLVASLNSLRNNILQLQYFSGVVASGSGSVEDEDTINTALKQFQELYNQNVMDKSSMDEGNALNAIKNLGTVHEAQLNQIGLSFNADNGRLEFSGNQNIFDPDFAKAYLSLFSTDDEASFGAAVTTQCQNVFYLIVKPDDIGVTIINQYA